MEKKRKGEKGEREAVVWEKGQESKKKEEREKKGKESQPWRGWEKAREQE